MESRGSKSHGGAQDLPPEQTVIAKPMTFQSKLKMMIIRIGDEKRQLIDEHIKKLKDVLLSDETQKQHKQLAIDTINACITNLPHKVIIYTALISAISLDSEQFAVEIVNKIAESLQEALVQEMNIQVSKNLMKFVAFAVDFRLISSQLFSQTLLQILDEANSLKHHSIDLVLETIITALPIAASRMIKEQGLDYGTILETLKKLMNKRHQQSSLLNQALQPIPDKSKDFLTFFWDTFQQQNSDRDIHYDKVYMSISSGFEKDLKAKVKPCIKELPSQLSFVEYQPVTTKTWQNSLNSKKQSVVVRYNSRYYVQSVDIKVENQFDLVNSIDLIGSVITAFQDSQQMAAHNLWNLYIHEDLRDVLPHLILNAIFTQLFHFPSPSRPPLFYTSLLLQIISQTKNSSLFKSFQPLLEESFSSLSKALSESKNESRDRLMDVICFYVSQIDFKADSLLQKMEDLGLDEETIKEIGGQMVRMSFIKKLQQNINEKFHKYLPEDQHFASLVLTYSDNENPDARLIMDSLNSKETPQNLKALLADSSKFEASGIVLKQIFLECILSKSRKSLEHFKRFIEVYYNEIFKGFFLEDEDKEKSQIAAIDTIYTVWQNNDRRCVQLIEKCWQLGILEAENIINWTFSKLKKNADEKKANQGSILFKLIKVITQRMTDKSDYLISLFNQRGNPVNPKPDHQPKGDHPMEGEEQRPVAADLTLNKRLNLVQPEDYEREFENVQREQVRYFKSLVNHYCQFLSQHDDEEVAYSMITVLRSYKQEALQFINEAKIDLPHGANAINVLQAL